MRWFAWTAWLACAVPSAHALDVSLDASQYTHNAWRVREGFTEAAAHSIAQTADGYLWLGTEKGLVRFDGVRATPWHPPEGQALPDELIRTLAAARDGSLWIGTLQGLASLRAGRLTLWPELDGFIVNGIQEDSRGTVWVTGTAPSGPKVCSVRDDRMKCRGADGSLGQFLSTICEDSHGRVWVANERGLVRMFPGEPQAYAVPDGIAHVLHVLAPGPEGSVFVLTDTGTVVRVVDGQVVRGALPVKLPAKAKGILRDRDGGLWISLNDRGVAHVHEGRLDIFTRADGLTSDAVSAAYEDSEGNVWLSTLEGLDRFGAVSAAWLTTREGLSSNVVSALAAARDGSVWLSTAGGLNRWRDGKITALPGKGWPRRVASLMEDSSGRMWIGAPDGIGYAEGGRFVRVDGIVPTYVDAIVQDTAGNIWIALREQGLVKRSPEGRVEVTPWDRLGRGDAGSRLAADPAGGLWIGFREGGVARLVEGRVVVSQGRGVGLASGFVRSLHVQADGTLWIGTPRGLVRMKDGRTATLGMANGLPCESFDSMLEDAAGTFWVYSDCGLMRIEREQWTAWAAAADRAAAQAPDVRARLLDAGDGVPGGNWVGSFGPHAGLARDGRLWFLTSQGVSVVDPSKSLIDPRPPPVRIERAIADRTVLDVEEGGTQRLRALVRDLQIDYTALAFAAPQKVRFRVRLEGRDADWQEAGTRRQAFYTDLPPGDYRFHVIAANNNGVWNLEGATLAFTIPPAYYQTGWFRAALAVAVVALLSTLYFLRLRRLQRQFEARVRVRVAERTRIARELHDTLLQSFQGVLLKFHTASSLLPAQPDEAKRRLDQVIDEAAHAIEEGRDAVQGLRASTAISNDLAEELGRLVAERGGEDAPQLRVDVKGEPRDLVPLVRDEVHRIVREAVRNAFRHSRARHVDVHIQYERRSLTARVRDDGTGIPAEVLAAGGRAGHYGLAGMEERAQLAGGTLTLRSGPGLGTEVVLQIPASLAYLKGSRGRKDRRDTGVE
jgi:signal transduction histidine kinase/ligand-binding sensor domain-containing protein